MRIDLNVNVSGAITFVHQVAAVPGTSPGATQADVNAAEAQILAKLDATIAALQASEKNLADLAEIKRKFDSLDPAAPP